LVISNYPFSLVEKKPYITFLVQRQEINNVKKLIIVIHKKSATILSAHYFSPQKIEAAKT